jgi:hypothetical protein
MTVRGRDAPMADTRAVRAMTLRLHPANFGRWRSETGRHIADIQSLRYHLG